MSTFLDSSVERVNDVSGDEEPSFNTCTPKPVGALIRGEKRDSSVIKYKITSTPGYVLILHCIAVRGLILNHAGYKTDENYILYFIFWFDFCHEKLFRLNKE